MKLPDSAARPRLLGLLVPLVLAVLALATPARAQSVAVLWGDSIMCGFNADLADGTPWGPAPFGDPLPCGYRWHPHTLSFEPITPRDNLQGLGADPAYGFAYGWKRLFGEDVYIVSMGIPGSDVDPGLGAGSWHPSAANSRFNALRTDIVNTLGNATWHAGTGQPARIAAILFTTGNNHPTTNLVADIEAVNSAIMALDPGCNPVQLGVRSWELAQPNTTLNRTLIPAWWQAAPLGERRAIVDATSIPGRTGGLVDGVHLRHFGNIMVGYYSVIIARCTP